MYYLFAYNRGLFKSYYYHFLFLPFKKPSNIMQNIFNSIFIYILEKNLLLNKYKK